MARNLYALGAVTSLAILCKVVTVYPSTSHIMTQYILHGTVQRNLIIINNESTIHNSNIYSTISCKDNNENECGFH